ncbi:MULTISPECIES: branched-chain amino acid ABC transporter ATP-binding protein/permease [unclassified Achromobacter]|uniref:branched-chain amino acid ABC transporter ATP-binding protein/permease n=1 Tax=unclassified Achromobacter TaxID=2626865 RepID=UPI000B516B90|nr:MULTISPECIES: branched-chain amino acid ABC transporter ATP-binding protein/permease [unclassified Achromobacter]OWT74502.1 ABC transporter [Achromobacter sp. HZ34]OWT78969.1 ABC transporter [Achromobacter sp. HZ28]
MNSKSLSLGVAVAAATLVLAFTLNSYYVFVLAQIALLAIVGVGLNVLLGLTGQVSFGHVGFYAIGAYTVAILTTKAGWSFWPAWVAGTLLAAALGALVALPALRVKGPYLAMITIAFSFIVQHAFIEMDGLTGGQSGIMGVLPPQLVAGWGPEQTITVLAVAAAAVLLAAYARFSNGAWGAAMRAVKDSETAAQSIGLNPLVIKTVAFTLSAATAGLAGGLFAPLSGFVTPDTFNFMQSILFVLVVVLGGAATVAGPVIGALVVGALPELLASLEDYRLLFFGALLLVVLWVAPDGLVGLWRQVAGRMGERRRIDAETNAPANSRIDGQAARGERDPATGPAATQAAMGAGTSAASTSGNSTSGNSTSGMGLAARPRAMLAAQGLGITFGGVRAVNELSMQVPAGAVTSLIGPNGAGKTTALNMLSGYYLPSAGAVLLGERALTGQAAFRVARSGVARTYQTSQLFGSLSVEDNVVLAMGRGRLGGLLAARGPRGGQALARARALLAYCGYRGGAQVMAADLAHVDRRLVEIARALATDPDVLLLDEPAAGLSREDKHMLATLLRRIADAGIGVAIVEHDMALVMSISDQLVVLDAGRRLAVGTPAEIQNDPAVKQAYLGESLDGQIDAARGGDGAGNGASRAPGAELLGVSDLVAGYGAEPVLHGISLQVREGEMVALLGANGAGKSTLMRTLAGLHGSQSGAMHIDGNTIEGAAAETVVGMGLVLVPEGRQVFPELSVLDNLRLGGFLHQAGIEARVQEMLDRFPRLRERLHQRAGLLSGGEQQMLAVARGLMSRPRVLLLDEPSLGLAPKVIAELFTSLDRLRAENMTILLVDQMAGLALALADRAYVLESGRVVAQGTSAEIAADDALANAYLHA